jgi:hypothetical protein
MRPDDDRLSAEDLEIGRRLVRNLAGLDSFIPAPPPMARIETGAVARPAERLPSARFEGRPAGAAVAFVVVVVGVVAVGLLGPRLAPAVESPVAGGPASPTTSPSRTAALTQGASPTRTEAPSPVALATLPPSVKLDEEIMGISWSPGGTRIAVLTMSAENRNVTFLDRSGRVMGSVAAVKVVWIDEDRYIADTSNGMMLGQIGSSSAQRISGHFKEVVGGAGTYAALVLDEVGSDHYRIWGPDGLGAPRDGVPIAFSPDGGMLAVVHYPRACCAGGPSPAATIAPGPPTLDVVRVLDGRSLVTNEDVVWAYTAYLAFSADGRFIAFDMNTPQSLQGVGILEIGNGRLWSLEPHAGGQYSLQTLAWAGSDRVLILGSPKSLPAGLPVSVMEVLQDNPFVYAASDGKVATIRPSSNKLTISSGEGTRTLDLPDFGISAAWAPDGSMLAVACGSTEGHNTRELALVQP